MVTYAQAQETAEDWINGGVPQELRREVRVREFDLGFVCWAADRADTPDPGVGGAVRMVIARDSGATTLWPAVPVNEVVRRYEEVYGRPASATPAGTPAPPSRDSAEATSFLLSPPQWLKDAGEAALAAEAARLGPADPDQPPPPRPEPVAPSVMVAPPVPDGPPADVPTMLSPPERPAPRRAAPARPDEAGSPQGGGPGGGPFPGGPQPGPGGAPFPGGPGGQGPSQGGGPGGGPFAGGPGPQRPSQGGGTPGFPGPTGGPSADRPGDIAASAGPSGGPGRPTAPPYPGQGAGRAPAGPPDDYAPTVMSPALDIPGRPGGRGGNPGAPPPPPPPGLLSSSSGGRGSNPGAPPPPPPPGLLASGSRNAGSAPPPPPAPPGFVGSGGGQGADPGDIADAHTSRASMPGRGRPAAPPSPPQSAGDYVPTQLAPGFNPGGAGAPATPPPPRPPASPQGRAGQAGTGAPGEPASAPPPPPGVRPVPLPPPPGAPVGYGYPGSPPPPPQQPAPPFPQGVPGMPGPGMPGMPGMPGVPGMPQPPVVPGVPTVGPGYLAVLSYRGPDGSEQKVMQRSEPGTPHPEWKILQELRRLNVPPEQVLELHTELECCDLPAGYCARMVKEAWPNVRISHTAPYGRDHTARQAGMRHLLEHLDELHALASGPSRPRPFRVPLPPPGSVAKLPPLAPQQLAGELGQVFGPALFRYEQRAVARQGVPEPVVQTLIWAGLPVEFGPFFWARAQPGRPIPTLAELAAERGRPAAPDAGGYLVLGNDYGRQLCVQYGTAAVVAVDLDGGPEQSAPRFVNSGVPEFVRSLALLGRMWRLRYGLTQEQAGRWTTDFQAQLAAIDPAALESPETWWAVILEQFWDGLL